MRDHVDPCGCGRDAFWAGYSSGFVEGLLEAAEQAGRYHERRRALLTQARDEEAKP